MPVRRLSLDRRPADRSPEGTAARLQRTVDRLAAQRRRGGHVVAGIGTLDGRFSWSGAAGQARPGVAMTPATPYFIASVTKLFIASATLRLHERGEVDLDGPVVAHLPGDLVAGLHRLDGVDHTSRITVRHLLGHTSGLPDYLEDAPRGGRSWYDDLEAGTDRSWTLDDALARARELEPHFPPADLSAGRVRARYSDTGYQLLIALVETVTGRSFADVLEEMFLRPLGMDQTYLPGRSEPLRPAPEAAVVYEGTKPVSIPRALVACNDLVSTVDDNLRFMRALARGEIFDGPATTGLMTERFNRIFYPMRYGLGVMRFPVSRLVSPTRRPLTLVGHSGSTGSWLFHCPELDVVLAGTIDQVRGHSAPFRIMPRLLRVAHDALR
jgi:D-alanyl-D-alanine carboxypeptidase